MKYYNMRNIFLGILLFFNLSFAMEEEKEKLIKWIDCGEFHADVGLTSNVQGVVDQNIDVMGTNFDGDTESFKSVMAQLVDKFEKEIALSKHYRAFIEPLVVKKLKDDKSQKEIYHL